MRLRFKRPNKPDFVAEYPDKEDMPRLYDEAWAAVPSVVKQRAIEILQKALDPVDVANIKKGYAEHGHDWPWHPPFTTKCDGFTAVFHSFGGMHVRNALRQGGLTDDKLPPFDAYYGPGTDVRNWDDYYIQAMEAAAGLRD